MRRCGWVGILVLWGCTSSEERKAEPGAPKPVAAEPEPGSSPDEPQESTPPPEPPAPPPIHDVWFASYEGSLVRVDEAGAMSVAWETQSRIGDLIVGPHGDVWAAQRRQVRQYGRDGFEDLAEAPWLISDLSVADDDTVWALGFNKVASHAAGTWTEVDPAKLEALALEYIADLVVDGEGAAWIMGRGGVARHAVGGEFVKVDPPLVEKFRPAHFTRSPDGAVVLAHFDGLSRRTGESWEAVDLKGGTTSSRAPALRAVAYNEPGELVFSEIMSRCVVVDADGYRLVTDRRRLQQETPALSIWSVALDDKRRAWIGTDAGVVVDGKTFWASPSLPSTKGKITHILARGDGPATLPEIQEQGPGTIQGTFVVDGKPGANLSFEVCKDPATSLGSLGSPCETEDPSSGGTTDAEGRFKVEGMPPGRYGFAVHLGSAHWKVVRSSECCAELPVDLGRLDVSKGQKVKGMSRQELEDMEAFEDADDGSGQRE